MSSVSLGRIINFPQPLQVTIRPSRYLLATVIAAHGLTIPALWVAALVSPWQIGGTAVLIASAVYYSLQLSRTPVSALEADETGYRLLHQGLWTDAVLHQAIITAPLTVMQFKLASGMRIAVPLLVDSMAADDYRHLRVWLKWVRYGAKDG